MVFRKEYVASHALIMDESRWHPSRVQPWYEIETGGIAPLNHRLMSTTHSG